MLKTNRLIFIITFILCLFIQVLPVIRSGLPYSYGYGFWGPTGHDSIWHLSLINNFDQPLKITMPVFSGVKLTNYHPFFDILIADLSLITHISSSIWLFQIFPIVSTIIFLVLSYFLGQKISKNPSGGVILMFLNSFSNSFGWLVTLIKDHQIGGESLFWAMQSVSHQINPPFILSVIFILAVILILLRQKNYYLLIPLIVLIPITKAYGAVPAFIILGIYSLRAIFNQQYRLPIISTISIIISLFIFFYFNPSSSSLLVLKPFWFTNSMVESIDRFYWPQVANWLHSPNLIKIIIAESIAIFIFIVGNFSWRLFGAFTLIKKNSFDVYTYLTAIIVCTIIPTLFVQQGTAWNTIQFIYYALLLGNILLTKYLVNHRNILFIVVVTSLLASLPTLQNYLGNPSPAVLTYAEKQALEFLKNQPEGIVLTYPYDQFIKSKMTTPIPLYAYETTSYISAFSHHPTYVDDYMNLSNSGFDYLPRLQESKQFFKQNNVFQDRGFLINNQISYIYLTANQRNITNLKIGEMSLKQIFTNQEVSIYQVQK